MRVLELSADMMTRTQVCKNGTVQETREEEEEDDKESTCSPEKAWQCISQLGHKVSYYGTSQSDRQMCR